MSQISKYIVLIVSLTLSGQIYAGPLEGKAFFVDPSGFELVPGGQDITGFMDVDTKSMVVDPWGPFLGLLVVTNNIEILDLGTYTRDAGTVTVLEGQVGAHMEIEWGGNIIPIYMVWNVSGGNVFIIADSDSDGIPGHAMNSGPFPGFSAYYEFTIDGGPSGPFVILEIDTNGSNHECSDGGAEVTMSATPQLFGGAVLESVTWELNGESLGEGLIKTEDLELGDYLVTATALTTTGETDIVSASFSVLDTTRPIVRVAFIDKNGFGNEVESAGPGQVEISIKATDTCDPNPVIISSVARKATLVSDGDRLSITASLDNLKLPTTAINVTATAKDASGNFSLTTSESSKSLTLE